MHGAAEVRAKSSAKADSSLGTHGLGAWQGNAKELASFVAHRFSTAHRTMCHQHCSSVSSSGEGDRKRTQVHRRGNGNAAARGSGPSFWGF